MLEWLTYSISDFVLFSPDVYWRLVSRYLTELSYFPVIIAASYLALLYCMATQKQLKLVLIYFALMWAWLGWQFYSNHYITINWFAEYLGYACLAQALLMIIACWRIEHHNLKHNQNHKPRSHDHLAYVATITTSLVLMPILALTASLPWSLGLMGLMPIPTALVTLMLLIQIPKNRKLKWWLILYLLPILILIIELLTLDQLSLQLLSRY